MEIRRHFLSTHSEVHFFALRLLRQETALIHMMILNHWNSQQLSIGLPCRRKFSQTLSLTLHPQMPVVYCVVEALRGHQSLHGIGGTQGGILWYFSLVRRGDFLSLPPNVKVLEKFTLPSSLLDSLRSSLGIGVNSSGNS